MNGAAAAPARWDRPVTEDEIVEGLTALGLRVGETVLLHSSLRRVGWVIGDANTVVRACLRVIGAAGTLVVPAQTVGNTDPSQWERTLGQAVPEEWWPTIREHLPAFDPRTDRSQGMGRIAEAVRTWPGAIRSAHPQSSFAAVGPRAARTMAGHAVDCHLGEDSPLPRLADVDAVVLLLGVGFESCTCFHLAEYRQPEPAVRSYSCVVAGPGARREWLHYQDVALSAHDFGLIGEAFESTTPQGTVRRARVGRATARAFPLGIAVDFATDWMRRHRR